MTTPHYYPLNSRVERAIRIAREGIKRDKGPLRQKLRRVIESYENLHHRRIDMTPQVELQVENCVMISKKKKVAREFQKVDYPEFRIGQKVL